MRLGILDSSRSRRFRPCRADSGRFDRPREFRGRRRHGRRAGQRSNCRLADHDHGRQRQGRPLYLPRGQATARQLRSAHPRGRLRTRRPSSCRGAGKQSCDGRSQVAQDQRPRGSAHQHRMVHQHARHVRAETPADRMHELPYLRARRAVEIQRRGDVQGFAANAAIRQQHHHAKSPAACCGAQRQSRHHPPHR